MEYSTFKEIYDTLSQEYQSAIFNLLRGMEHIEENPKEIDYSKGLKEAIFYNDLSIDKLSEILEKDQNISLRNSVASVINRGSTSSEYFEDILKILEIDRNFLYENSKYFLNKYNDLETCFKSLSERNQQAVFYLMLNLSHPYDESHQQPIELSNLGLEKEDTFY